MTTTASTTKCAHKHYAVCTHDRATRMADRANQYAEWVATHCISHGELRVARSPLIGPMYCLCSYDRPEWLAEKV